MSISTEVKSLGKSKWTYAVVGAFVGALVLYAPITALVNFVRAKLPVGFPGSTNTNSTASTAGQ